MVSFEMFFVILALISGFYMAWSIGANDVANAVGTSVGSRALTLKQAVILAAILEFSGAYFFGAEVTQTVQKGVINTEMFNQNPTVLIVGMISVLLASGAWLQLASYCGWPVSTTHSIIGALVGFGAIVGGVHAIDWSNVTSIVASWVVSPICGGVISFILFMVIRKLIFYSPYPVEIARRMMPYLSAIVIFILGLILLSDNLHRFGIEESIFHLVVICSALSCLSWIVSKIFQKYYFSKSGEENSQDSFSAPLIEIEKSMKSLNKAKNSVNGDLSYQLARIEDSISSLRANLIRQQKKNSSQQYQEVEKVFSGLQILTAAFMAFAHGANDVANAIGPLAAVICIVQTGNTALNVAVPPWILALGGLGITVGLATWGWRVIETIGKKITELTPTRGFSAEFGTAITIVLASKMGLPVSTTHILVGAVLGVGLARGLGSLDLSQLKNIFISWVITVPVGAILAICFYYLVTFMMSFCF